MEMKILPLTQEDKNWIEVGMEMADEIVSHYVPDWDRKEITHFILDSAFAGWLKDQKIYEEDMIVNSLGIALGEYMVRHLTMQWVTVTDQYGATMAVHHENPEWTTFPFDALRKRVQTKETPFVAFLYSDAEKAILH